MSPATGVPRDWRFWIASGLGSGLAPRAPGTFGTLAALLPWLLLRELPLWAYLGFVLATFLLGVWLSDALTGDGQAEDPGWIVIDEWIGLWIALIAVPAGWVWPLIGFALFRLFDIWKPWPVGWADRELEGGLGVMTDDALAGLMALAVLQGLAYGVAGWL